MIKTLILIASIFIASSQGKNLGGDVMKASNAKYPE